MANLSLGLNRPQTGLEEALKESASIRDTAVQQAQTQSQIVSGLRSQPFEGMSSAQKIGVGLGQMLFGQSKDLTDAEKKQAEQLAKVAELEDIVAKQSQLVEANKALQSVQGKVDADVMNALLEYKRGGNSLTPAVEDRIRSVLSLPEVQKANLLRGVQPQAINFSKNEAGDLFVNITDQNGVTRSSLARNLLSDNGAGLDTIATGAATAGIKAIDERIAGATEQTAIEQAEANLAGTQARAQRDVAEARDVSATPFDEATSKVQEQQIERILNTANSAEQRLLAIEQAASVIDNAATGELSDLRIMMADFATMAGLEDLIPNIDQIKDLATLRDAGKKGVIDKIVEGGRGFTDTDRQVVQEGMVNINDTKQVAKVGLMMSILADNTALTQRDILGGATTGAEKQEAIQEVQGRRTEAVRGIMEVMSNDKFKDAPFNKLREFFRKKGWLN